MNWIKKYKAIVILAIGIIGILILNADKLNSIVKSDPIPYNESLITTNNTKSIDYVMVDVKGEVLYPGLYEIPSDKRIGDVINIAGGLSEIADVSSVNLAQKIEDEMTIFIPAKPSYHDDIADEIVKIIVEIKGEVNHPGVYELYHNQRVMDLIMIAGGLTELADTSSISLVSILEDQAVIEIPKKQTSESNQNSSIVVEIKGEVNEPGIYTVPEGSRTVDLILLAKGLTDNANELELELAHKLVDGETIVVSRLQDYQNTRLIYVEIHGEILHPGTYQIEEGSTILDLIYLAGGVTTNCDLSKMNWDIILCLGATIYIPSYDDDLPNQEQSNLININTADLETLMTLNGIGQILGQRIIDYRAEYGFFLSIEEIMNVSGIKDSIYEQIKEFITV